MAAAAEAETEHIPDDELIRRITADDEAAFELLYERYFPRVYRFVSKRLRNRTDAEETVQEVFINIYSSIGSFRGEAPFVAWVLGLTRRTIAARFKKKRHTTVPLMGDENPDDAVMLNSLGQREPTPLEHYECGERVEQIEQAARKNLTEEQWQLFESHHLQHFSIQEIAKTFHKTEDAVKSNLYRARRMLLAR